MAIKTHKVTLSLDNPRVIQSGINVQSFDKQSIQISIELTKNDEVFQVPSDATIRISLLKLARQEQKIIVDVPNANRDSIDWIVPDYLDGYQGTVRVGVYLVSGTENVDLGYFTILSNVSDIDKMADEFVDNVFQGWEQIEADLNELNLTIAQTKLDLADDLTQIDNTIANINTLASDFTADVATKQSDVTSKYNAFDTSVTQANQTIDDILALQLQFQSVLDETTGKDVISAPELIAARNGKSNLKTRLDDEHAQVTAQLQQTQQELTDQFNQAVGAVTEDSEVVLARSEYPTLKERLDAEWDNVNVQLAEKVQNFKLKNEVVNGDFSQGITEWSHYPYARPYVITNDLCTFDFTEWVYTSGAQIRQTLFSPIIVGNKYYLRFFFDYRGLANYPVRAGFETVSSGVPNKDYVEFNPTSKIESFVLEPTVSIHTIQIRHFMKSNESESITVGKMSLINITQAFGAGNEPTKLEMDELMKVIPNQWWDGELTLTQKQHVTWQLNLIRKNTNAIIALGGTII